MSPPATLNEEVRIACFEQGGYPQRWERHPACPCCGSGSLFPSFSKNNIWHSSCCNCGFICIDPYPPAEILRQLYAGSYYSLTRELYEVPRLRDQGVITAYTAPTELLNDTIKKCVRGRVSGTWLDVGGGIGAFAKLVATTNQSWQVSLNEMNPRSAKLASEIFDLRVERSEPQETCASGRRFDVISAISVLEHIVEPLSFVKDYANLIQPGGLFVVIVPHFTPLSANVAKASSPMVAPPFHASLFNRRNIKTLFDRGGAFEGIEIDEFGGPAFSLLQHVDYSDYWDISIPTPEKPEPVGLMLRPYPKEMAMVINKLAEADAAIGPNFFSETDGRMYLKVIARRAAQ